MRDNSQARASAMDMEYDDGINVFELLGILLKQWKWLVAGPLAVGVLAIGGSFLVTPTFTAKTTFLPPQQQQSAAAAALSQIGALAGLAGGSGVKNPADQYVALLQSESVADRIVDKFKLMDVFGANYRFEARKALAENVRIGVGKKDGLIGVEVDDTNPERAASIANQYVAELRRMTNELALTEAQQRRAFFEQQLKTTQANLINAQQALQVSGFNPGALKTEPRAAADAYAQLSAEVTAAEVKLQTLRRALADGAPEVQAQQAMLSALRGQLAKAESANAPTRGADYVTKYREFKYHETLFELLSRQYELARLDESQEGTLIQVVDVAQVPEWKSKPKRALVGVAATVIAFLVIAGAILVRHYRRPESNQPA